MNMCFALWGHVEVVWSIEQSQVTHHTTRHRLHLCRRDKGRGKSLFLGQLVPHYSFNSICVSFLLLLHRHVYLHMGLSDMQLRSSNVFLSCLTRIKNSILITHKEIVSWHIGRSTVTLQSSFNTLMKTWKWWSFYCYCITCVSQFYSMKTKGR